MKQNKRVKQLLKFVIIILVLVAIMIICYILSNIKNNKTTANSVPQLQYTEEEAQEFYSKKLISYLNTFKNDFYIKYIATTLNEDGTETTRNEEFAKKGTVVAMYSLDENQRIVLEDEYFYHVSENDKIIYKLKKDKDLSLNMDVLLYSLEDMNTLYLESGNETLNDTQYYYEVYKMKKDNSVLVKYYFDENNILKYIRAYKENSTVNTFFKIEQIESKTYDFMFDLNESYQIVDMTK